MLHLGCDVLNAAAVLTARCCVCFRDLVPLHNARSYGHYEVIEVLVKVSVTLSGSSRTGTVHMVGVGVIPILIRPVSVCSTVPA